MHAPAVYHGSSLRVYAQPTAITEYFVFFPYAGGTASTGRQLIEGLPATYTGLAVQYPGKGDRKDEPEPASIEQLGAAIFADLKAAAILGSLPLTLYGHSMGAAVAFDTARRIEHAGHRLKRVCVSGRRAPSVTLGFSLPLSDEVILEGIVTSGGVSPTVLRSPKFRDMIVEGVRNDYSINVAYLASKEVRLSSDLRFLLSDADPYVRIDDARAWGVHAKGKFDIQSFSGGHFFINQNIPAVGKSFSEA